MSAPTRPEVWLRGRLPGIDPVLPPATYGEIRRAGLPATGQYITTLKIARGHRTPPAA